MNNLRGGRLPDCYALGNVTQQNAKLGLPVFGTPGGWGMMQVDLAGGQFLDPQALWNWRDNIAAWMQYIFGPLASINPGDTSASYGYSFWRRQYDDWSRFYTDNGYPDLPQPLQVGANCRFLYTRDYISPAVSNPALVPQSAWLGDAIVMKNIGGSTVNYASFIIGTGAWLINPTQYNPTSNTNQDIVREFCDFKP